MDMHPKAFASKLLMRLAVLAARNCGACLALVVGYIVMPLNAHAAQAVSWAPFDLPKLQQTTLRSAAGAPYRIVVATPASKPPAAGYPVIYVVDGNAWTGLVSEIIRTNLETGIQSRVEPAVVVGIGYPVAEAFDLKRRSLDFTSAATPGHPDPDVLPGPNGGDVTLMNFIDNTVKPVIEARFPVDRTRQTLIGHSLGGLFTLEALFARPGSFQTYVALSPSIWWNNRTPLRQAQDFLAKGGRPAKLRVFLSVGDLEQFRSPTYVAHDRYDDRKAFEADGKTDAQADADVAVGYASMDRRTMVTNARQMAALLTGHITTKFVEFPDEDHFSVVPAALGQAVPFALGDELPPW
ncbi:alpha/beta hydrolase [Lichenicoccus sp.]|uniref:alpha/beta hydrolase n=1 Tax=Lichenicoccus sp. TaxID=2781899 RepID=UPI003D151FC5